MHVLLSVGCWFRDFSSHVACDVYEYISQLATACSRLERVWVTVGGGGAEHATLRCRQRHGQQRAQQRNQHAKLYFIDSKLTVIYVCLITPTQPTHRLFALSLSPSLSGMQPMLLCIAIEGPRLWPPFACLPPPALLEPRCASVP